MFREPCFQAGFGSPAIWIIDQLRHFWRDNPSTQSSHVPVCKGHLRLGYGLYPMVVRSCSTYLWKWQCKLIVR